jgi:hypothetical protein
MLYLLPIDAGKSPETLRSHTLEVGKQIGEAAVEKPPAAAAPITVTLDSTFIRSREDGERHVEVRVGNVETADGGRQIFGAVTRAETDFTALVRRSLETAGRVDTTEVTAFTDGLPGFARHTDQSRSDETADFGLVSYRDAFGTHQANGGKFVDRRA